MGREKCLEEAASLVLANVEIKNLEKEKKKKKKP